MKLVPLLENVKPKLLELQEWLLEKGWDDVELNRVSDTEYKLTLSHGPNGNFQRRFWCDVDGDRITGWYTVGYGQARSMTRMTDRELMDTAVGELAYIMVRHMLKVKFIDKPDSFEEVQRASVVPYSKLKPLIDDYVLETIDGLTLYGQLGRPRGPLASHKGTTTPPIFIVSFKGGELDRWLVDSTGANSYYREWAAIDYEA